MRIMEMNKVIPCSMTLLIEKDVRRKRKHSQYQNYDLGVKIYPPVTQKIYIHKDFLNMLNTEDIDDVASCTL